MQARIRFFGFSAAVTVLVAVASVYYLGVGALLPLLVLSVIEITFSFDNAVVNARILGRLSRRWQQMFLSVGIIIAIFGMRLLFPILIVALTAGLGWHQVVDLALNHPAIYADKLQAAHPTITAFGGAFLLMLALHFFMDAEKQHHWFGRFERAVQAIGKWWLPTIVTAVILGLLAVLPVNHHPAETLKAGVVGMLTYGALQALAIIMARKTGDTKRAAGLTGWAAFAMFLYLELLDASFSLDGVLGAFAITGDVLLIVAGLGIGAVWVRSLTVYMVRRGILDAYKYLEHGAHYAIAVLAAAMLLGALVEVPDALTGVVGLAFIVGSVLASRRTTA